MQSALRSALRAQIARPRVQRTIPTAARSLFRVPHIRTLTTTKYTVEHEFVTFDDTTGVGIVGITNHAQEQLGDVVFVELPKVGAEVKKGDQIGAVESVKSASDIYAPVSGVIEEINTELDGQPGLLNKSAEGDGWLCKIKLAESTELDGLLTEEQYKKSVDEGH